MLLVGISAVGDGVPPGDKLPAKSSKEYNEVVRAFYIGLAALQVGDDVRADSKLAQVTQLVPAEPAGGPTGDCSPCASGISTGGRATGTRSFARSGERSNLLPAGIAGKQPRAIGRSDHRACAKQSRSIRRNLLATYKLAEEIERQGDENSEAEYQQLIQKMLEVQPDNLAVLLELGRIAAKRGDADTLRRVVSKIAERSSAWPAGSATAA